MTRPSLPLCFSNSVNIYVGIGIPWLIGTAYNFIAYREPLHIENAAGLSFSLLVFFSTSIGCIGVLVLRRLTLGAELGGPRFWAWVTCIYLMLLWLIFLVLSSLQVSGIIWGKSHNPGYLHWIVFVPFYWDSCLFYMPFIEQFFFWALKTTDQFLILLNGRNTVNYRHGHQETLVSILGHHLWVAMLFLHFIARIW